MEEIRQGNVYWVDFGVPAGSEPGFRRPCVVVQNDVFNASRLNTVVICAVTSNLTLQRSPGKLRKVLDGINLPLKPSEIAAA